ncbi:MAG: CRISPR-associated endonuclease Cas1 [Nitrospirae bacterium]|nr:CRISPR-associated endonuclease Cas1 [Nitrospirota bacterium]
MGTLYIDRKDLLIRLDGNSLAFYANGQREGVVPINPLKRVVVVGNVTLETPVLHKLANEDVSVVFLSGKRLRFSGVLHGKLHNNGILRLRQYEKSLSGFALEAARDILIRKVLNQKAFLEDVTTQRPDLRLELTAAVNTLSGILDKIREAAMPIESLRGMEGGASASYFPAYTGIFAPSLEFRKRNRRPPEDPVNAMLSLCYTLLHYEMLREIEVIGLDPTIGFYHQFDYGRESLACDLVEPYRPDVDRFVWELFRKRVFTSRDFSTEDERPGCYLKKESRKSFYPDYEEWAKLMRQQWTEEVRNLARRLMDGKDPLSE